MKLIVGLGNPGEKYIGVRHNLGFAVLDELIRKGTTINEQFRINDKLKAEILKTPDFILAKPQTYMNNSGIAVSAIAKYFKILPEEIIIIHDELDLPFGKIKVRIGGAAAGHHGVESIIDALKTDKFIRVRLGIGNLKTLGAEAKKQYIGTEKFVLEPFTHSEQPQIKHLVKQAIKAVEILLEKGLQQAQNQYN